MRDGDNCFVATVHEIAMGRPLSAVLIVFTAVVSQAPSLHAQDSRGAPGRVAGKVVNGVTGAGIPSAQVTVEGTPNAAITNWAGEYALTDLAAGVHTVSVRAIGYASKFVAAVSVHGGATTRLDVTLSAAARRRSARPSFGRQVAEAHMAPLPALSRRLLQSRDTPAVGW